MHVWRDIWPEPSVVFVLIAMIGGMALTFLLTLEEKRWVDEERNLMPVRLMTTGRSLLYRGMPQDVSDFYVRIYIDSVMQCA